MPDVPSVAQLRALWENQLAATTSPSESEGNTVHCNQHLFSSSVRSGNQDDRPVHVTHYVDDVAPFPRARTRPPFAGSSEEESGSEPRSLSGSSTQHYADDVLTHDDDRSSSHVTESTVEANLDAELYKQEGDRPMEIISVQYDAVAKSESEAKALADVVNAQRVNIEEMTGLNKAIAESHKAQIEQRERQAEQMHDAMEELRKANADLATRFAQLTVDTSHPWGPASQTFSSEVVLPGWSVDVTVLPPVEPSNVTQPASGGNAPASGNRNEVFSTGGRLPPIEEGPISVTSYGGRRPPAGGGPLPPSASGGNAPACGEVEAAGPSTRQTRAERADSNIRVIFAACEDFERSDGRWIIHPRSGERLWVKDREKSTRIKKLWSKEPQESHRSTPACGGNAPRTRESHQYLLR